MKEKKILIIAHFFYPCNLIASHRPKSWADSLTKAGYDVTVVTRNWTGKEKNWDEYLGNNSTPISETKHDANFKIIYLPFKNNIIFQWMNFGFLKKMKILKFLIGLMLTLIGKIDFDRDVYKNYYKFLKHHLKDNHYDIIITTSGPFLTLKIMMKLKKKFKFIWFADFRDVWDVELLKEDKKKIKNTIRFIFHKYYIKKWVTKVDYIISCTEGFDSVFSDIAAGKEVILIKNGFESNLYFGIKKEEKKDKFIILCLGTLYQEQNRKIFYSAIKDVQKEIKEKNIIIKFIGAKVNNMVAEEIRQNIDKDILVLTGFIDRDKALYETVNADLLFYPVWEGYKGIYSGKIFEYLGAKINILLTPKDNSVLDQLLDETNAGKSFNDGVSCSAYILELYNEWKTSSKVKFNGNQEMINKYTRENQAKILIDKIDTLLEKK